MNIYTEHPNIFPKEIFHVFKNQDFQPSKIRHFPLEIHQSETNHYSKENAAKGIALKHEFKTPAIMNSHKLPKAFNNVSNDRLNHEKINEIIKKPESNKNVKLIFEEADIKKNNFFSEKKSPKHSFQTPQINEPQKEKAEQKSLNFKLTKNPIVPLKNFFKIAKQNENDFFQDSSNTKLIEFRCNKLEVNKNLEEKFQMNEMTTLSIINSTNQSNQIKIMLHIPSLKTFAIREESLMNIGNFHPRKKLLNIWQTTLNSSDLFVKIYELFWNYPEGYTSILCEMMRGGSLKNLMEYVGCLNESLLKSLGIFLLRAYKDFFIMTKLSLGTLSLSQILFDDQGNIKIGPKLSWSYFSPKMSNFTSWRMLFSKILPIDTLTLNTHGNTPNNDIFEIGLILLYCAIGDIELFDCNAGSGDLKKNSDEMKETMFLKSDTNFFLNDRKKELKTEENMEFDKEIIGSSCCLLHLLWECCEEKKVGDYLKKRHSSKFFKSFSRKNGIFMKIILQKRFSKEFIDFLCCCLRFEQKNKVDIEIMMDHSFFNSNIEKGNNISLKEIVRISSNWKLNSSDFAIKETIGHIIQSLFIVLEEKNITKQKFLEGNHMEKLINVLALDLGMSQKMISDIVKAQIHKI